MAGGQGWPWAPRRQMSCLLTWKEVFNPVLHRGPSEGTTWLLNGQFCAGYGAPELEARRRVGRHSYWALAVRRECSTSPEGNENTEGEQDLEPRTGPGTQRCLFPKLSCLVYTLPHTGLTLVYPTLPPLPPLLNRLAQGNSWTRTGSHVCDLPPCSRCRKSLHA